MPSAPGHHTGGRSLGSVARRWQWLVVTLAAVAVSCFVPGSMLSQPLPQAGSGTMITAAAPSPSGIECAVVSCNRGSPSSTVPLPSITLAGAIAAGILVTLTLYTLRRVRHGVVVLPAGSPSALLRPPQHLLPA